MPASGLIKDTTFGHFLRAVCGPRILPYFDELDLETALVLMTGTQSPSTPSAHSAELAAERRDIRRNEPPKATAHHSPSPDAGFSVIPTATDLNAFMEESEKKDTQLVGWYGPDDPDVRALFLCAVLHPELTCLAEPSELEPCKEGMGTIPDVLLHLRNLHRLLHIHGGYLRCSGEVRRQRGRRHTWAHGLRSVLSFKDACLLLTSS